MEMEKEHDALLDAWVEIKRKEFVVRVKIFKLMEFIAKVSETEPHQSQWGK